VIRWTPARIRFVLGIIGDPGAAFSLTRELAETELRCEPNVAIVSVSALGVAACVQHPDDEDEIEMAA
jgi:hypothetical protein